MSPTTYFIMTWRISQCWPGALPGCYHVSRLSPLLSALFGAMNWMYYLRLRLVRFEGRRYEIRKQYDAHENTGVGGCVQLSTFFALICMNLDGLFELKYCLFSMPFIFGGGLGTSCSSYLRSTIRFGGMLRRCRKYISGSWMHTRLTAMWHG